MRATALDRLAHRKAIALVCIDRKCQPKIARQIFIGRSGNSALELERGAHVNRLAVATVVLERRHAITLNIVADATGKGDLAGK